MGEQVLLCSGSILSVLLVKFSNIMILVVVPDLFIEQLTEVTTVTTMLKLFIRINYSDKVRIEVCTIPITIPITILTIPLETTMKVFYLLGQIGVGRH